MSVAIDDVKNCVKYSIRDEVNFKARPVPENNFRQIVHEDDPAVMIFTSGTTGKLKGVIL